MAAAQNGTHTWLKWRYGHTMSCQIFSQSSWGNLQTPPPCPQMEVPRCHPVTKAISNHQPMEMVSKRINAYLPICLVFLENVQYLLNMSEASIRGF